MKEPKQIVLEHVDVIKGLENEIKEAKERLQEALLKTTEEIDIDFLKWYYWETDLSLEYLPSSKFSKKDGIMSKIGKYKMGVKCISCCKYIYDIAKNREDKKRLLSYYKRLETSNNERSKMCESCQHKFDVRKETEEDSKNREKNLMYATMPYEEYLKTRKWRRFARKIKKDSGFKCQECGEQLDLEVHHLTYERRGYEKDEDVIVLCHECHSGRHGIVIEKPQFISIREKLAQKTGIKLS
jgi:hypothetical protein